MNTPTTRQIPATPICQSTRRTLLKLGALGLLTPTWLAGCGGSDRDVNAELRQLMAQHWQARYAGKPGGLSLKMITPGGEYFASTLDSVTADWHFRGASTTKTFTAAAIMLLDQRGLLRIDDLLTGLMPGRSDPYLPDMPGYAIPYKSQTHFVTDGSDSRLPSPFISGFSQVAGEITRYDDYNYSYDQGSGNIMTTPNDLARWIRRLLRGEAGIDAFHVASMCNVYRDSNYGLGILHKFGADFDLGYGHNGGTAGYLTDAYHDPKTDVSYVLQCSLIDFDDMLGQSKKLATGLQACRSNVFWKGFASPPKTVAPETPAFRPGSAPTALKGGFQTGVSFR